MDWFKGKFTGNHGFLPLNIGVSCKFSPKPIHWSIVAAFPVKTPIVAASPKDTGEKKALLLKRIDATWTETGAVKLGTQIWWFYSYWCGAKRREWMGCWGLLGWFLIVSQWIIPENSLLSWMHNWLVVSTPPKNISQWEGLSHIWNGK